jgi:C-terminal processing protease CtpA/Prc
MGLTVGGSIRRQIARVATPVSVGKYTVDRPVMFMHPEGGGSLLSTRKVVGSSFLQHFVVTFDGINSRVQLASGPDEPISPPAVRWLGLSLKQVGEQMEVWAVHPDSPAEALGLGEGDRIHAFDGRPAAETFRSPRWRAFLQTADTVTVTYAPSGSGPTRDVELRVVELLP